MSQQQRQTWESGVQGLLIQLFYHVNEMYLICAMLCLELILKLMNGMTSHLGSPDKQVLLNRISLYVAEKRIVFVFLPPKKRKN